MINNTLVNFYAIIGLIKKKSIVLEGHWKASNIYSFNFVLKRGYHIK